MTAGDCTSLQMMLQSFNWMYMALADNTWIKLTVRRFTLCELPFHCTSLLYMNLADFTINGSSWLYMVSYKYTWLLLSVHGFSGLYNEHGFIWIYMGLAYFKWFHLTPATVHGLSWLYSVWADFNWLHLTFHSSVYYTRLQYTTNSFSCLIWL